jgi:hypothetical protein
LLCIFGNSNGLKDIVIKARRAKAVEWKISVWLSLSLSLLSICLSPCLYLFIYSLYLLFRLSFLFISFVAPRSKEEVLLKRIFNPESINIFKMYCIIFKLIYIVALGEILIMLDTDIKLKKKSSWCTKFTYSFVKNPKVTSF